MGEEKRLNNTDPDRWMIGKWKGTSYQTDNYGNLTEIIILLDIGKYGHTTQLIKSSTGSTEYELVDLEYDRRAQQLVFKEGNNRIVYNVDIQAKTLSTGDMVLFKR